MWLSSKAAPREAQEIVSFSQGPLPMKTLPTREKLRGGYYTPPAVAKFLADWAIQSPNARVLEPACGDGVFLEAATRRLLELEVAPPALASRLYGVELDSDAADLAGLRLNQTFPSLKLPIIHSGDFFEHCLGPLAGQRFDVVLGNPPFIRYQNFPEPHRDIAFRLMQSLGLHPNRLTNAWLPFVALGTEMLASHGRIAMIVPAELLQVNYAAELRKFLSDRLARLTIFTFKHLLFGKVQQEVVLLSGEKDGSGATGIRTIELTGVDSLGAYEHRAFTRHGLKPMDHSRDKWTLYFLTKEQLRLLRDLRAAEGLVRLGDLADVDVGVVTGLNDFFVLTKSVLESIGAEKNHVMPLVSRSAHLGKGLVFSRDDWKRNRGDDLTAFLLTLPDLPKGRLPKSIQTYIREAEAKKWHLGFKCRIRSPWYKVPSVWVPDAFLLRQIHDLPRLVVNKSGATSTDTIHRVRARMWADVPRLAAAFFNSLTFAFSEVVGRSYGGGVLELEPREAEELPIPWEAAEMIDPEKLDCLLSAGRLKEGLDYADGILLVKGLGLRQEQARQLREVWARLRKRRLARKNGASQERRGSVRSSSTTARVGANLD